MDINFDFDRYDVPRWSPFAAGEYRVETDQRLTEPVPAAIQFNRAAWNLYFALAKPTGSFLSLHRLPLSVEAELPRVVKMQFRLRSKGNEWSLAALMCALGPEEYMNRYGHALAALLNLPRDYKHQFVR